MPALGEADQADQVQGQPGVYIDTLSPWPAGIEEEEENLIGGKAPVGIFFLLMNEAYVDLPRAQQRK